MIAASTMRNKDTKKLTVIYDSSKLSNDLIQKNIAIIGHGTEKKSVDDKMYEKLPGCCLYDRKKTSKSQSANHKH